MRLIACTASGALSAISCAERAHLLLEELVRDDLVDEAELEALLRASSVRPVNAISHAFAQPTRRGSSHVPPLSGRTPRFAKPPGELGLVRRDADVAADREVHAVAGRGAVERADRRLVHGVEHGRRRVAQVEARRHRVRIAADALARHQVLEIEAGAEALARAGQHDDAHLRVGLGVHQRLRERVEHRDGDRVQTLRAVQRDRRDRAVDGVEQVGHAGYLRPAR